MNAWINKSMSLLTTDENSYVEGKEWEGMCLELSTYFCEPLWDSWILTLRNKSEIETRAQGKNRMKLKVRETWFGKVFLTTGGTNTSIHLTGKCCTPFLRVSQQALKGNNPSMHTHYVPPVSDSEQVPDTVGMQVGSIGNALLCSSVFPLCWVLSLPLTHSSKWSIHSKRERSLW